jgi:hypothetical protein
MRAITVWFTEEEFDRLEALAALHGTLPSEFMKELFKRERVRLEALGTVPEPSDDPPTIPSGPAAIRRKSSYPRFRLDHEDDEDI